VIPPAQDATFAAALEAVLDLYARPRDPRFPLVCFDEAGKELRAHKRPPHLLRPGSAQRIDAEYVRQGSANLFLWVAPYEGVRHITATERRCAGDVAHALREVVAAFPEAEKVVLLTDNLNVHAPASLYKTFPRDEARRILARLEWHFTPKHGSWLNLAEIELAALHGQCLERRIPDLPTLQHEVTAWAERRNARRQTIAWSFTADDAYARLRHVYPVPEQDIVG
jgi:DDE superfamily endonuclease